MNNKGTKSTCIRDPQSKSTQHTNGKCIQYPVPSQDNFTSVDGPMVMTTR